ncbi:MAG TPA: DUF3592 domain-containing protein [Trebonia sp.]|nr:DUF3592 domain-containing protein [Trebonia sp.]
MPAAPSANVNNNDFDPAIPTALPLFGKATVTGKIPVRLRAEGDTLVAYGYGRQRIVFSAGDVSRIQVRILRNSQNGEDMGSYLLVRGKSNSKSKSTEILLWARGAWGPGLAEICAQLGLPKPEVATTRPFTETLAPTVGRPYPLLRTHPRNWIPLLLAGILGVLVMVGLGIFAGVGLALLLPPAIGDVRDLIAIILAAAGVLGGVWVAFATRSMSIGAVRWAVASRRAGGPAPVGPFLSLDVPSHVISTVTTVLLALAIPFLLIWGPAVAITSAVHGFRDAALVSDLRTSGSATVGYVVNVPSYSTDSQGNTTVTPHAYLQFIPEGRSAVSEPDPAIGGQTWPMGTGQLVTIYYDPADPVKAAVEGQITGSVWHGAPTGNVISGALAIAIEPALIWLFYRRVTAKRRKAARDFAEGLA